MHVFTLNQLLYTISEMLQREYHYNHQWGLAQGQQAHTPHEVERGFSARRSSTQLHAVARTAKATYTKAQHSAVARSCAHGKNNLNTSPAHLYAPVRGQTEAKNYFPHY